MAKAGPISRQAGKILLLLVAFFATAGVTQKAWAQTYTSSCSSQLVSTPLCEEIESQACSELESPQEEPKQIQAAVVIAEGVAGSRGAGQTSGQTAPQVLPTMTALNDEYAVPDVALDSESIFDLVNQYRASLGLAPFEKDDKVCELAQTRSTEISGELTNGTLHSGLYNRNLPYWIFENAKVGSDEEGTLSWWLSSPLHHESIVRDYKFSCVKCKGSVCSELFTSYSPKSGDLGE